MAFFAMFSFVPGARLEWRFMDPGCLSILWERVFLFYVALRGRCV